MDWSETRASIAAALVKAQGSVKDAVRDGKNNRNSYATLESVLASVRPAFTDAGLAILQSPQEIGGGVVVETTIIHESGEWCRSSISTPIEGKGMSTVQQMGSAITYLRRYSLMAIAGIAPEDDDGASAGNATVKARKSGKTPVMVFEETVQAAGLQVPDVFDYVKSQGWPVPETDSQFTDLTNWLKDPESVKHVRDFLKPEPETEAPAVPFGSPEAQRAFFGRMKEHIGPEAPMTYEDVKAWCKAHDRPKPSELDSEKLAAFEAWISSGEGVERIVTWLSREAGA